MSWVFLSGGLIERPMSKVVKVKPGSPWRTQDIGDACQGKKQNGCRTNREKNVLQSTKSKELDF